MKVGQRVTPTGVLVAPSGIPEDEWLELRKTGIGGSDVGALLGMSKYTSPYELYLEKRGELPPIPRSDALERAAMWGHLHEPLIAARFSQLHGLKTRRIGLIRHIDDGWRLANLDRQVCGCPDGPCGLEIKNRSAYKASEWGETGDPEGVPDIEALQTHHYLAVTGYRHFHVAVLINGNDDRYFRVERDEDLIGDVVALETTFWKRVQDGDPPPVDGSEASGELLAQLWTGQEAAERVVDPVTVAELIADRDRLDEQAAEVKTARDEISNQLKAMLGDAEVAVADGRPVFTWKQNGAFAAARFRKAYPDLAAKYVRMVEAVDTDALAADHPDIYRANRARVLRITTTRGKEAA